jgi:hypothetical protein
VTARRTLLGCLLFSVVTMAGTGPGTAPDVLEAGARGVVLTVLDGEEIREIPLEYLGTYENFGGPGFDLHLVELQGDEAEHVGIANGMSGSPVYVDGELIGALSYRLGFMPKKPVAGVTPIANMREVRRAEGHSAPRAEAGMEPISTPLLVGGMSADVRDWLSTQLDGMGFVVVAGGGGTRGERGAVELRPGSPVGVELVRGDTKIAATGTVTMIEDDNVYAFGHPFLGTGRVEMPMVSAEVVHTLADLAGSLKLANVGEEMGAIVEDRLGGVVGRLGRSAPMIPIEVKVLGADYGNETFRYEMIRHPQLAPVLAGSVVATSLRTVGYNAEVTMLAHGRVRLRDLPDLPIEMAFASSVDGDPGIAIATEVLQVLRSLSVNPFEALAIEGIEIEIDARVEPVSYTVEDVQYDRGAIGPGEPLRVRCVLRRYRGESVVRELEVPLPEALPGRNGLALVVGNPQTVDGALGGTISERMRSAKDLPSIVEILKDRRGANRLTAVVYRTGGALVSRGAEYTDLPPTAERLLATQAGPRTQPSAPFVSPVGRAEAMLDGPVRGGQRIRLRVERQEGSGGSD